MWPTYSIPPPLLVAPVISHRDSTSEQLVMVAEEDPEKPIADKQALLDMVRKFVARCHGLQIADFRVLLAGQLLRTPNDKIRHRAVAEVYTFGHY